MSDNKPWFAALDGEIVCPPTVDDHHRWTFAYENGQLCASRTFLPASSLSPESPPAPFAELYATPKGADQLVIRVSYRHSVAAWILHVPWEDEFEPLDARISVWRHELRLQLPAIEAAYARLTHESCCCCSGSGWVLLAESRDKWQPCNDGCAAGKHNQETIDALRRSQHKQQVTCDHITDLWAEVNNIYEAYDEGLSGTVAASKLAKVCLVYLMAHIEREAGSR